MFMYKMPLIHWWLYGCKCHLFIDGYMDVNVTYSLMVIWMQMSLIHWWLYGCRCHLFIDGYMDVNVTYSMVVTKM